MCYYIGWSYDKEDTIFCKEDKKTKIDKRVRKMHRTIARRGIIFDYMFIKNDKALLKLSVFLPPKYEHKRQKQLKKKLEDG